MYTVRCSYTTRIIFLILGSNVKMNNEDKWSLNECILFVFRSPISRPSSDFWKQILLKFNLYGCTFYNYCTIRSKKCETVAKRLIESL